MTFLKRIAAGALALTLSAGLLTGCNGASKADQLSGKPEKGQTVATIRVKDYGDIKVMLYPDVAPKGVENFVTHAKENYYDGLTFHRVIEDFMAQGGDPEGTGMGGESIWGSPFETEYDGSLHHYTGALAYANSGRDTNGSQFFLVYTAPVGKDMIEQLKAANDTYQANGLEAPYPTDETVLENYTKVGGAPWLDNGDFTVFGQVYEGLDVLEKIINCEKDPDKLDASGAPYVPSPAVVIDTIEISEYEG